MKVIRTYGSIVLILCFLMSCQQQETEFKTDSQDYDSFLANRPAKETYNVPMLGDNNIKSDSLRLLSMGKVSGEYHRFLGQTGDIQFLKNAERYLRNALITSSADQAEHLRALSRNHMAQHKFKEALAIAEESLRLNSAINESQKLLFDLHMELGNYSRADRYLDSIRSMPDFGYLIRAAKWDDHKGNLDSAIQFMEKAIAVAEMEKNKAQLLWAYTKLADFYGHAARIEDSYQCYLRALHIEPRNAYAKKGIAWIVYSYERNGTEALRILDSILKQHQSPEYYLLKAEIADFMQNDMLRVQALDDYYKLVRNNPQYAHMYNARNVDFLIDMDVDQKAYKLAQEEVDNRPTPESYGWLAYSLLHIGEKEKAMKILEKHVIGATFEPLVLHQAAEIYKANGKTQKVQELKQKLLGAIYELGPMKEAQIASL